MWWCGGGVFCGVVVVVVWCGVVGVLLVWCLGVLVGVGCVMGVGAVP